MYIELHARSAFSFLEGSSLPEDMAAMCAKFDMPAMALLDTDGLYGAPRFHLAADKIGIKAHIGAEVSCQPFDSVILSAASTSRSEVLAESKACPEPAEGDPYARQVAQEIEVPRFARNDKLFKNRKVNSTDNSFRLPLLVSSRVGYQNLCRMITKMKLRAKKGEGAVLPEELEEHAQGLICLTGGAAGPLAAALQQGGIEAARKQVEQLAGIFGYGNVYIELQRHFHREEESRNRAAIDIARLLNLPLLATNGVNYAPEKVRELCDAFTAIHHHRTLATAGRLLSRNAERHLKSPQAMQQLFADLPEAIQNTLELSSRLEFTLNDLGYEFPRYP
ncbi:MAG: PHP domain-containing protein, partial [Candidatus Sulfotelmatobacter sp.]